MHTCIQGKQAGRRPSSSIPPFSLKRSVCVCSGAHLCIQDGLPCKLLGREKEESKKEGTRLKDNNRKQRRKAVTKHERDTLEGSREETEALVRTKELRWPCVPQSPPLSRTSCSSERSRKKHAWVPPLDERR
mmetsp:Transcript_238/g.593  ORF Transcript_238/g.593 Transcript_238/m.593 type:complete len:132 (+) Transcript_238:414-809(+)